MMSTYLFFVITLAMSASAPAIDNQYTVNEESLFLGRGMGGVVIALNPDYSQSDLRQYISHLDRSQSSVEALIPTLGTGSFDGLLDVVGSEHPVDHRNTGIEAH